MLPHRNSKQDLKLSPFSFKYFLENPLISLLDYGKNLILTKLGYIKKQNILRLFLCILRSWTWYIYQYG